jgi:hypothetical protein
MSFDPVVRMLPSSVDSMLHQPAAVAVTHTVLQVPNDYNK